MDSGYVEGCPISHDNGDVDSSLFRTWNKTGKTFHFGKSAPNILGSLPLHAIGTKKEVPQ